MPSGTRLTDEQKEKILEGFANKLPSKKIAEELGITHAGVNRIISINGLKRDPNERRKYPINDHVFSIIDNEYSAYWLGFVAADGCVHKNLLSIKLSAKDEEHLLKFRDWVQPGKSVNRQKGESQINGRIINSSASVQVIISSSKIVGDLEKLGIYPNKSQNMKPLRVDSIDPSLLRHYYRGYVDGDGSVRLSYRNGEYNPPTDARVHVCGTKHFLEDFQGWINRSLGTESSKLYYSTGIWKFSRDGLYRVGALVSLLYEDCSVYLRRKYRVALGIMQWADVLGKSHVDGRMEKLCKAVLDIDRVS